MTELDIAPMIVWVAAISSLLGFGTTIYNLLTSGSKANAKKLDTLDTDMKLHDARLGALENELKHLPTKDQVNDLRLGISQIEGSVTGLNAAVHALTRTVGNIDTYLRRESK